jgi:hypothetical protein
MENQNTKWYQRKKNPIHSSAQGYNRTNFVVVGVVGTDITHSSEMAILEVRDLVLFLFPLYIKKTNKKFLK